MGFKASAAQQKMLAIAKSERAAVEKLLSTVLSAFNEQVATRLVCQEASLTPGRTASQHSQYLASKALFDKRSQAAERSKAGEIKLLTAMIEMHLHLVRLFRTLVELR